MRSLILPVSRWRRKVRVTKTTQLTDFIETSLTHNMILRLMASWRLKVRPTQLIKTQRKLKLYLATRRAVYSNLMIKWEKTEKEVLKELADQGMQAKEIATNFNAPTEVKRFVMRSKVKDTINRHNLAKVVHRLEVRSVVKGYRQNAETLKARGDYSWLEDDLLLPPEPVISLNFNSTTMREMILKAQVLKPYWGKIVTSLNHYVTERELARLLNDKSSFEETPHSQSGAASRPNSTKHDTAELLGHTSPKIPIDTKHYRTISVPTPKTQGTRRNSVTLVSHHPAPNSDIPLQQPHRRESLTISAKRSRRNSQELTNPTALTMPKPQVKR